MADSNRVEALREVVARHGIRATRALGQHFLHDRNLIRRIVRAAGPLDDRRVLEVGAGPGGLTRELLAAGAVEVVAIERDRRCLAALDELAGDFPGRLRVVAADALEVDEASLVSTPVKIVANLPYNIATELFFKWQARPEQFESLTVMLQKEVAERFAAAPRTKAYGRLAVMAQWRYRVRRMFDVPPASFVPPPRVTSTVIQLVPLAEPVAPAEAGSMRRVVAQAFGQRRKMLRRALRGLPCDTAALLAAAGVAEDARAEELGIAEFCALARSFDRLARGTGDE